MVETGRMPQCTICKQYAFSAGHWLPNVGEGHPCRRSHGHNYVVEVMASGELEQRRGWVVDFAELDRYVKPIIAKLDHQMLNDFMQNPTVEWLAWWIHAKIPVKYSGLTVRVWETPKCYAETKGQLPQWLRKEFEWTIDSSG